MHIQALRPRRITSSTGNNLSSDLSRCHALKHSSLQPRSPHTYTHTHGLSDAKSRSNWLASEAWVSSGSSVALWEEVICYAWKPLKPTEENKCFTCIMQGIHAYVCLSVCACRKISLHTHSLKQKWVMDGKMRGEISLPACAHATCWGELEKSSPILIMLRLIAVSHPQGLHEDTDDKHSRHSYKTQSGKREWLSFSR